MRTACIHAVAAATKRTMEMGRSQPRRGGTLLALSMLALLWVTDARAHADLNLWFTHGPVDQCDEQCNQQQIVYAIAVAPSNTSVVYAGAHGVFKSTDGGESWVQKTTGLPLFPIPDPPAPQNKIYRTVLALAVDPKHSSIVYAGTDFNCPHAPCSDTDPNSDIFKSTDGGDTWTPIGALTP